MAEPQEGKIVTAFTDVIFNHGNHFDPSTGKFAAPVDGIYVACLTVHQMNQGEVTLQVRRQPRDASAHKCCVFEVSTAEDWDRDCQFSFVQMKAGDKLYVKSVAVRGDVFLTSFSSFSCLLFF